MKASSLILVSTFTLTTVHAQDIPYGIEFVAGIRSGYHQRGIQLADDLLDLQLQSNVTISKSSSLTVAAWQGAEMGGDFHEFGALTSLSKSYDGFSLTAELAYTSYNSEVADSGVEGNLVVDVPVSENASFFANIGYHEGASSFFASAGTSGSMRLTDESFLSGKVSLNAADDYFGREGLYDITSRISYTTNINSGLSVTPYLSLSAPLDGEGDLNTSLGVWIEIFF